MVRDVPPGLTRSKLLGAAALAVAASALAGCGEAAERARPAPAAIVALGQGGVVLQRTDADCGIAALLMVLRDRGVETNRSRVARTAGLTPTGTSLGGLRRGLAAHGVASRPWRLTPQDLARAPKPAVAWFGGNHFVLVDRVTASGRVTVRDPALGRFELAASTFAQKWTGETLVIGRFAPA